MKIIYNRILPFKGFKAINVFGLCLARKGSHLSVTLVTHEMIHSAQQRELLYVFFYLLYFLEWLLRLITNPGNAYRSISFEKEAYLNQHDRSYLETRRHYAMWRKQYK